MFTKNVPPVPVINADRVINLIESKVYQLEEDEKQTIIDLISFHECEPMAAAERISDLLGVDYHSILELL